MHTMVILAALLTVLAALWGACGMPRAVDTLLKHKAEAMASYWESMRFELASYMENGKIDDSCPKEVVKWAMRQRTQAGGKKLTREQTCALKEMGLVCETTETESLPTSEKAYAAYSLEATPLTRAACAVACSIMPDLCTLMAATDLLGSELALPAGALIAGTVAWVIMCAVLACDIKARLIPWQLCAALMVVAALFALCGPSEGGPAFMNLAMGALIGLLVYIACRAVNGAMRFLTGAGAIGQGDLRLMPALCVLCGMYGSLVGFAAATVVMLILAVVALVKGATKRDYIPYAPGLAVWALCGTLAQLACVGSGVMI